MQQSNATVTALVIRKISLVAASRAGEVLRVMIASRGSRYRRAALRRFAVLLGVFTEAAVTGAIAFALPIPSMGFGELPPRASRVPQVMPRRHVLCA